MRRKHALLGMLAAGCFVALLAPSLAHAQDAAAKVKASMAALKAETAKLGAPKLEGADKVGDKDVPALYFGTSKVNNDYKVVDEVVKQHGGTATLFVKSGDEF